MPPFQTASLILANCHVFDGHSRDILTDRHLLIEGGRITAMSDVLPEAAKARHVDCAGRFVMPGLIDCHFHACGSTLDFARLEGLPATYSAQHAAAALKAALARGFTTVRDARGADRGLWMALEEGVIEGPRLFFCGKALSQTGGHGDARPSHAEPCACAMSGTLAQVVDGVDAVRGAVREAFRQGAHHIKMFVSGGIISPSDPIWMLQYSWDEIEAAVDEAARRRSYVMAHAYTGETIERAVKAGVRSIEHGNLITPGAARMVAAKGAYVVPTLSIYDALEREGRSAGAPEMMIEKLEAVRRQGLEAIETCISAGVKLGLGTDLLGPLHRYQLAELRLRAEVQSPFDVLHSATAVNAEIIQMVDELGCVRVGALADLIIVDGNPLEDLAVLTDAPNGRRHTVLKGGMMVHEAAP